jgi:predicted amidophosphoribosyltransferase
LLLWNFISPIICRAPASVILSASPKRFRAKGPFFGFPYLCDAPTVRKTTFRAYFCRMRTLFSSKKCPHCDQWSAWQQLADDRCEHCHELLDPQAQHRLDEQEQVAQQPISQFMLIEIKPTDGAVARFFKYLVRGGQLAFAALMAFLLWVITALAG